MLVKKEFNLISKTPNVINVPSSFLKSYFFEENSFEQLKSILELRKKSLVHFTNKKIFDLISDVRKRDSIQIFEFESYVLCATYNFQTKQMIVNLKPFQKSDITEMSYNDLYAAILYAYTFSQLVTEKFLVKETYIKPIVNYITSMFVQVFGKEYGLDSTYAGMVIRLRFLISCYVHAAFFGASPGPSLFKKATTTSSYNYQSEQDVLMTYDFSRIIDFIKALSDLKVAPGLTPIKFTTKIHRFFGIEMIAAFEDLSRFLCSILVSSVPGSVLVPGYIEKYNQREYYNIIEITKRMF
jgi:hypothetical protein